MSESVSLAPPALNLKRALDPGFARVSDDPSGPRARKSPVACSGIAQAAIGFRPAYPNVARIYAHPRNMGTEVGAGNPRWNRTRALDLGFKRMVRSLAKKKLGGYYLSAIVGTRAP